MRSRNVLLIVLVVGIRSAGVGRTQVDHADERLDAATALSAVSGLFEQVPLEGNYWLKQRACSCWVQLHQGVVLNEVGVAWTAMSPAAPGLFVSRMAFWEMPGFNPVRYVAISRSSNPVCIDFGQDHDSWISAGSDAGRHESGKALLQAALLSVLVDTEEQILLAGVIGDTASVLGAVYQLDELLSTPRESRAETERSIGVNCLAWFATPLSPGSITGSTVGGGETDIIIRRADSINYVSFELLYCAFAKPSYVLGRFEVGLHQGDVIDSRKTVVESWDSMDSLMTYWEVRSGRANRMLHR